MVRQNVIKWVFGVVLAIVIILCLRTQYHYTNGYDRKDGTHVAGYWHNVPDGMKWNNLSNYGVSIRGK